jgi:succinate dehydrogenase / fumarate reductase cytochrome b subunit
VSKSTKDNRPKNLNLLTIRLPINAIVSILHRVSGIVLFLMLPFILLTFKVSLTSEESYLILLNVLDHWLIKLVLISIAWAFLHHFFAGLRHLAQDVHWMHDLQQARTSSRLLFGLVALSVLFFAIVIW